MSGRAGTLFLMVMHEVRGRVMTAELVEEHVEHIRKLDLDGNLVVCGPFLTRFGAVKVLRASSMEEARELAEADPFIREGVETYELLEFEHGHKGNNYLLKQE